MAVVNPVGSTTNPQSGLWVPRGSLDRWKAARGLHASQLVEVVCFGDSTTYGQTSSGNATNSANNYSIVQKMRALALAAGFTDGGLGVRGFNDTANMSGSDALAHIQSNAGSFVVSTTNSNPLLTAGLFTSNQANSSACVVQGKGTKARIWYHQVGSGASVAQTMTYAVDGGSTTSVNGFSSTARDKIQCAEVTLGAYGTHTLTFTVTASGPIDFCVDWLRDTGIVFHKHGVPGTKLGDLFSATNGWAYYLGPALGTGVAQDLGNAATAPLNAPYGQSITGPRVPSLVILNAGINDVSGSTDQATANNLRQVAEAAVVTFGRMCQTAGVDGLVCIPHVQYSTNAREYSGNFRSAIFNAALSAGLAVFDLSASLGTYKNAVDNYAAGLAAPHLNQAGYDVQATALWNAISTV